MQPAQSVLGIRPAASVLQVGSWTLAASANDRTRGSTQDQLASEREWHPTCLMCHNAFTERNSDIMGQNI